MIKNNMRFSSFNSIDVTNVTCGGNSDNELTPPTNNGNFIPIMAKPSTTWDTFGLLYQRVDLDKYYLRTKGTTTQSYQITWIISRNFDI